MTRFKSEHTFYFEFLECKVSTRKMKRYLSGYFFIVVCSSLLSGQTLEKSEPEEITKMPVDSVLSWMQKNYTTNTTTFQKIGFEALARARVANKPAQVGQIHEELANWYGYHGLFPIDSTVYHSEQALNNYLLTEDKSKIAKAYSVLSVDYLNTNELEKAQDVLFKALELFEELRDDQGVASAYRSMSVLQGQMENFEESIDYAQKSIALFKKVDNHAQIAIAYFNLIKGYTALGAYEKAFAAADDCIQLAQTKAPEEIFVPVRAYSYRGDISIKNGNYGQALLDYTKAWELCVANIGEERSATYRTEIANALRLLGRYEEALENFMIGVAAYEADENENIWTIYEQMSECYAALGKEKEALTYFKKGTELKDRMLEGKIANLETEALVKYQSGKKDEALVAQAAVLEQKNKIQTLILSIGILLLLLLGAVYFFLRRSRKATRIITAKNSENELLLKEIHHRVKNNLEMVKSLIALQSAQLEDSATKDAMIASQNRVQSMGIIHQKLYQGTNLGSIEMKDYFVNLGDGILDTFNAEEQVKIALAMDQLELDIDTAVPIGLIVNELLTNSLKYAFPNKTKGKIEISLTKSDAGTLNLKVADNGVGKKQGVAPKGTGFGSQLIALLTQQLNGKMLEENQNGTIVSFLFNLPKAA